MKTDKERYVDACHAMQSGIAMMMNYDSASTTPKHLRVGVNSAMVDSSALANLLISKGIITEEEYFKAIADGMEKEVQDYKLRIRIALAKKLNLPKTKD